VGSTLSANMRAVMAVFVTHLATCTGGITWYMLNYRLEKKWLTISFYSSVIAKLISITLGSGE
jgi:ammonium transporter, Amt family